MKTFLITLGLTAQLCGGQTLADCHRRFNEYLNFKGSLNNVVGFDKNSLFILDKSGNKEIAIYEEELTILSDFLEGCDLDQQKIFFRKKGAKKLVKSELDSLSFCALEKKDAMFKGLKVAIDPGHFACNLKEAASEQKYLYYAHDKSKKDSVKLFESRLTFNTAVLLNSLLKRKGVETFITRNKEDFTSFNCTYTQWIKQHKKRTLDSLRSVGVLSEAKFVLLNKCNNKTFFWEFFRDYDLANRAKKINEFKPDITIIIHYNVDEKNAPWKKSSKKNFTMVFMAGAFTPNDLTKEESKINFLRLLITPQVDKSKFLGECTVRGFHKNLSIPVARPGDADYLRDNCISTSAQGVFCRNLLLNRKINSPLVYGEALYQDNELECFELMKQDLVEDGITTNKRLLAVARSYYEAIEQYLEKH